MTSTTAVKPSVHRDGTVWIGDAIIGHVENQGGGRPWMAVVHPRSLEDHRTFWWRRAAAVGYLALVAEDRNGERP